MENPVTALPQGATSPKSETREARWDRSAFRLHGLAMNRDLAAMASTPVLEPAQADPPLHWVLLDPVLASIVHSCVSHQKEITRLKGVVAAVSETQLVADVLVLLGVAGTSEPRGALACAHFAARLLWRSAALTVTQHREMERAAQARRPGWSRG
jgi:hypothetical protein